MKFTAPKSIVAIFALLATAACADASPFQFADPTTSGELFRYTLQTDPVTTVPVKFVSYAGLNYTDGGNFDSSTYLADSVTFQHSGPALPGNTITLPLGSFPTTPDYFGSVFGNATYINSSLSTGFLFAGLGVNGATLTDVSAPYSITLSGGAHDGLTTTIAFDPSFLPEIPLFTSATFSSLGAVGGGQPLEFSFVPVGSDSSFLSYSLYDITDGETYVTGGGIDSLAASLILDGSDLQSGRQYEFAIGNSTTIGSVTYLSQNAVRFSVPESGSVAGSLAASMALLGFARRKYSRLR